MHISLVGINPQGKPARSGGGGRLALPSPSSSRSVDQWSPRRGLHLQLPGLRIHPPSPLTETASTRAHALLPCLPLELTLSFSATWVSEPGGEGSARARGWLGRGGGGSERKDDGDAASIPCFTCAEEMVTAPDVLCSRLLEMAMDEVELELVALWRERRRSSRSRGGMGRTEGRASGERSARRPRIAWRLVRE